MADNKWLMFKNYMHNELGITKEDIHGWIKETVQEEAKRLINNEYGRFSLSDHLERSVPSKDWFCASRTAFKEDIIK